LNPSPNPEPSANGSDRLKGVLLVEGVALAIALVTPVTPSKTGSDWTFADVVWEEPSYLQEVAASFVVVNLLLMFIGLVIWIAVRFGPKST
jgi:hypothetical protein